MLGVHTNTTFCARKKLKKMKTINLNVYQFNELNEEAKQKAIENIRNSYYEHNDFLEWAIDDCALLEPSHKELIALYGDKYNFPLLWNNRKIYCSLDRNRYIDISNAMEVTNKEQFLTWLGLGSELIDKVNFVIGEDTIGFSEYDELTESEKLVLSEGAKKFEEHCQTVLNRIEADYEYSFTDEAIIEVIESNETEFLIDGSMYS